MAAPFRVEKTRGESEFAEYLGRLVTLIPGPALGIYLTGKGFVPSSAIGWWALVGLVLVLVFRIFGTQDRQRNLGPQWVGVVIAFVSFAIWVYAIGDQIATFALPASWIASLAVLVWTGIVPVFYKGD